MDSEVLQEETETAEDYRGSQPNIALSAAIALTIFVLDAFVFNQGVISMLVACVAVLVNLYRVLFTRKGRVALKRRLAIAVIYVAMAAGVMACNNANNAMARRNAGEIIQACEDFKISRGYYPQELTYLVPDFLPRVPRAKYTLQYNHFLYFVIEGRHRLAYFSLPPFGRPYYNFETREWGYVD